MALTGELMGPIIFWRIDLTLTLHEYSWVNFPPIRVKLKFGKYCLEMWINLVI